MELLLRVGLFILRLLGLLIYPIFWLIRQRKTPKLPSIKNNVLLLSATKLAEKIRKLEIQSEAVVLAYIKRINEVNPLLNAVVEQRFEDAVQEARKIDTFLSTLSMNGLEELAETQPLLGVPVTIKESCAVKGMCHAVGSIAREGFRASEDGAAVARIRKAGAIILLISNTPEFCLFWETKNHITGLTKNPYNTHYSSSGSSGGEAALLASAASVIGIGSDVAGSLRMPALLTGIFAHKSTAKLVNTEGHFPNTQSDTGKFNFAIGPMTRYAEDLELVFQVLAEQPNELHADKEVVLKELNVFHMLNAGPSIAHVSVDVETKLAINKCVEHLSLCGCNVDDYKFPMGNSIEITSSVFFYLEDMPNILGNPISDKQSDWLIFELLKQPFGCSNYTFNGLIFSILRAARGFVLPFRRERYLKELEVLKLEFEERLGTNGILLYPSFPTHAYQHNQFIFKLSGVQYQSIFNNLGLPCANVPLGMAKNGLPIGIQVIAGPNQDRLCFAVAKELERAFGGWQAPS